MKKHIIHAGIFVKAQEPIDERLYVDELSVTELERIWGESGEYSYSFAVIFNRDTKTWMYLSTHATNTDALVPANWTNVGSNAVAFPEYVASNSYGVGSCIWYTDGSNYTSFYIGTEVISANETPETNPEKWYDIQQSSSSEYVHYEQMHRLDVTDSNTHSLIVDVPSAVSNAGQNAPIVEVYADMGERVSSNIVWVPVSTTNKIYTEGGVSKVDIEFAGDIAAFPIEFNGGDPSQNNVKIVIK